MEGQLLLLALQSEISESGIRLEFLSTLKYFWIFVIGVQFIYQGTCEYHDQGKVGPVTLIICAHSFSLFSVFVRIGLN